MIVAELIEILQTLPQDYEIRIQYRDEGGIYFGNDKEVLLDIDKKSKTILL